MNLSIKTLLEEAIWPRLRQEGKHWLWTGALSKAGYACVNFNRGSRYVHRIMWTLLRGPIPPGMTLDHVTERCTHRNCVNPACMEVVTQAENARRGQRRRWAAVRNRGERPIFGSKQGLAASGRSYITGE